MSGSNAAARRKHALILSSIGLRALSRAWIVVLIACGPGDTHRGDADDTFVRTLVDIGVPRTALPRFAIPTAYRRCRVEPVSEGGEHKSSCDPPAHDDRTRLRVASLARSADSAVRATGSADALRTVALIDLVWSDSAGNSLQRSISYLGAAAERSDDPADVLADLAAAHLINAEKSGSPRALIESIDISRRALELDSTSMAARFNLALALDRLGLVEVAGDAWDGYLRTDSTSGWAHEARAMRTHVTESVLPLPDTDASSAQVALFAQRQAQDARIAGWEAALGDWGSAVLAGDTARAARHLHLASRLGTALEAIDGDRSLADAVQRIESTAANPARLRHEARAHVAYSVARRRWRDVPDSVARALGASIRNLDASPLRAWSLLTIAAAMVQLQHNDEAARIAEQVIRTSDEKRHPALAAQARWTMGTALVRSGRFESAARLFGEAAGLFRRAHEMENTGATESLVGDALYSMGDIAAMHDPMQRAVDILRDRRGSVWLHNTLYIWAEAIAGEGFLRAALDIQNEGVLVAMRTGRPEHEPEARLARARLIIRTGRADAAWDDIAASIPLVAAITEPRIRGWHEADLQIARAQTMLAGDPRGAATVLDSAVAYFVAARNSARLVPAVVARAHARLDARHGDAAEEDVARVLALIERSQKDITQLRNRATLIETARAITDRLVMLRVRHGDVADALGYLERTRRSLAPVEYSTYTTAANVVGPAGWTGVTHALIGDTLVTWTVRGADVRATTTVVGREALGHMIARVRLSLETRSPADAVRGDLAALHELLIRPASLNASQGDSALLIVSDGEFGDVPFAALRDARDGTHLIERYLLRFQPSFAAAPHAVPRERRVPARVLLVADPAFDTDALPGLSRLDGARQEVDSVAAFYPTARVLGDSAATVASLTTALSGARVLHYAGHAVFNDQRPEQSFLPLASAGDTVTDSRLPASAIERMRLPALDLVVLSACETSRTPSTRSAGFLGLAGAFLTAGADGVIGSTWRVQDDLTLPLMVAFHRAYSGSDSASVAGNGAAALQRAQRSMLASGNPEWSSPAAWAAFRYVGR